MKAGPILLSRHCPVVQVSQYHQYGNRRWRRRHLASCQQCREEADRNARAEAEAGEAR